MTRSRAAGAAAVLALHALLWLGWRLHAPPAAREAPPPAAAPLVVRLLSLPPPVAPAAPRPLPTPRPATAPPPARALAAPVRPEPALQVPAAAALPTVAEPAPSASPPAPPSPPPLVLDLPRGASAPRRSPALDDLRANTAPRTVASRIANAMAKDWTEEVLGDGRVRYRRGDECIQVQPSRDAQLDPINGSGRPKQAGSC